MVGFTAEFARGDLRVNREELEDARWFSIHELPDLPPKLSIARFLIDQFARPGLSRGAENQEKEAIWMPHGRAERDEEE